MTLCKVGKTHLKMIQWSISWWNVDPIQQVLLTRWWIPKLYPTRPVGTKGLVEGHNFSSKYDHTKQIKSRLEHSNVCFIYGSGEADILTQTQLRRSGSNMKHNMIVGLSSVTVTPLTSIQSKEKDIIKHMKRTLKEKLTKPL